MVARLVAGRMDLRADRESAAASWGAKPRFHAGLPMGPADAPRDAAPESLRSGGLHPDSPWALRDSNPRPLPCKGRKAQRSDGHLRKPGVVRRFTGIPLSTVWFRRLFDQVLTIEPG